MAPKTISAKSVAHFCQFPCTLRTPKINPKSTLGLRRGARKRFFVDFRRVNGFCNFWVFFHRFVMTNRCKIRCIFSKLRASFSTWRWLKSMHRRSVLSTFYFFHCCWKITQTTKQNWLPKKTSKNDAQGVPELTQNGSEFVKNLQKITKRPQQTWKLRGQSFDDFSSGQKTCPGGYNHPRESLKWSLGSSGG